MLAIFTLADIIALNAPYFLGLCIGNNFKTIPVSQLNAFLIFSLSFTVVEIAFFWLMRMYQSVWRFVGVKEMLRFFIAAASVSVVHCLCITFIFQPMPIAYYAVGALLSICLIIGVRFIRRAVYELKKEKPIIPAEIVAKRVMIIGAGDAGRNVIKELLHTNRVKLMPCCIIDDNQSRWGRYIENVPIVGGREEILTAVKEYGIEKIYFCIPTATAEQKRDILNVCSETGCEIKTLPGIYQLVSGDVLTSKLKPVQVEELLGRDPIKVNTEEILNYVKGKTILVTGGGGSIGSELCRQIASHSPKQLIIFDIYENNAYSIQLELKKKYPNLDLQTLIGSVRDSRRINAVMETYKPDIVYHAAAHKHVPLMEDSPNESIKNNVLGTYKTALAALKNGVKRFVLISTDKAVNPTNIMGASKRLCEMVIQSLDAIGKAGRLDLLPEVYAHGNNLDKIKDIAEEKLLQTGVKIESTNNENRSGTQFVAVRFGNVLGSNGSVIPLFKRQIEEGGPVTVTHPDIVRYFMTIPEAVSLVLQAGANAWGGEIFVLEMGEPVKIDTLARNLIKLSGYKPDEDIKIVYSGLRPGEKLYEEKLMAEEGLKQTDNKMIFIGKPIPFDVETFLKQLVWLADECYNNSPNIVADVEKVVATFHPVGREPEKALKNKPVTAN